MGLIFLSIFALFHVFFWITWKRDQFAYVDIAWGLGFIIAAVLGYLQNMPSIPKVLLLVMVTVWGLRLAWHIFKRIERQGEDPRYTEMRLGWGTDYLKIGYKKVFLLQALALFFISMPVQLGMSSELERFGIKQILGLLIWMAGFALEAWADWHLEKFKIDPSNKGRICMTGPWQYVRFPNYLGEIALWWGIYIYIFGFWTGWTIIGPALLTWIIVKHTGVALIEKRYQGRADYAEYMGKVPRFIPVFKSK